MARACNELGRCDLRIGMASGRPASLARATPKLNPQLAPDVTTIQGYFPSCAFSPMPVTTDVFVESLWRSVKYVEVYLKASPRRAPRSAAVSTSSIAAGRIQALTDARLARPTSIRRPLWRRREFSPRAGRDEGRA